MAHSTGARETSLPIELPPRGFDIGASIVCDGVMAKGDDRFSLNFGMGIGDAGMSGDIALHVNPRFVGGESDVLVLNTRLGGNWDTEDRGEGGNMRAPLRVGQAFQLSVLAGRDGYEIAFPGHPEFETHLYPYRLDSGLIDTINQEDNTLSSCTYIPPRGVCDDSIVSPVGATGSDSFESGDLSGWHTVNTQGSNDIFGGLPLHVPTVAFNGCNECFGP